MAEITVGFSSKSVDPKFIDYLKVSSGLKEIDVIAKENKGKKSLSQVYNEILSESKTDIVVLCHDDLYFDSKKWGEKILKHFEKSEYGILGVAGTTYLPKSGQWWEDPTKMVGIVNHESEGKKWESKYSDDLLNKIKNVVIVDGLFIAIDKRKIKSRFNENVRGFHMYDVNFCFENFLSDVRIGVVFDIRITHKSIGKTNEQWDSNRKNFSEVFYENLPAISKVNPDDFLKILFVVENVNDYTKVLNDDFFKNKDVTVVSDFFSKELKKEFSKIGIKAFLMKDIPGYKLGDGRSFVKTNEGVVKTEPNVYYKTSDVRYDFVICDKKENFDIIKFMWSSTPKIFLKKYTNNLGKHDSIKNYIGYEEINSLPKNILESLNTIPEFKQKIKILTGYSERGGSTTALINLTNYFNENGIDATMYGPHKWHLTKCKSDLLQNLKLEKTDKLITHYLQLENRPPVETVILTSHELGWFPVGKIPQHWDKVVFLHDKHREFHSDYHGEFEIIPNFREELTPGNKKPNVEKIAGIIGTIETRKQTHMSIIRALEDGCEKIYLFGKVGEETYFKNFVENFLKDPKVELKGFTENKQEMYDSIGRVYHSSIGEVACLVKDECFYTNTQFFGNEQTEHQISDFTNQEILELWKKTLQI